MVGDAEEGFHSCPQLSAHLRLAEHKAVPSDGWVTSPCQAHCLPDGVLGRQGGCRRRSGFSVVSRDGHCLPPARLGSPQHKDLASNPSAGISPGRTGAGRALHTTTRSCTSELWEAARQGPAHPGPAGHHTPAAQGHPNLCAARQPNSVPELLHRGALGLHSLAQQLWWDVGY